MSARLQVDELAALDAAVQGALDAGAAGALRILGYGEISCVVAWPAAAGELACKRLPPFPSRAAFEAYHRCVERYLERLAQAGITPVDTVVQAHPLADGRLAGYLVQPVLAEDTLLPRRLAQLDDAASGALFDRLLDRIEAAVGPTLGVDGQLSNWALSAEGDLSYLDVSTPMLRDERGREQLDTDLFLASLPWLLRGLVKRFMLGAILDKYYQPRGVVLDLLGNLYKERLEARLPELLARAEARVRPPLEVEEVRRYYRDDARMWGLLQRLRRIDRAWQRRVRRRTYPFLLPGEIERHV